MKRAARIDANQPAVVKAFRSCGATVQHLHTVGKGCPDLVVGMHTANGARINLLIEIKDGDKPAGQQKLTPDEQKWHDEWAGSVDIVRSADEAIELCKEVYEAGRI